MRFALIAATMLQPVICAACLPPPTAKADYVQPQSPAAGCLGSRLLSHAAYRPAGDGPAVRCGQPLSTDTVMKVRRWDRT